MATTQADSATAWGNLSSTGNGVHQSQRPLSRRVRRERRLIVSTVVDTDIVQRLGTYFPGARGQVLYSNGVKGNPSRDLQVTTLDRTNEGIADPSVKTWTNVTYDNNCALADADWNQKLTGLGLGTAFDWYLGTVKMIRLKHFLRQHMSSTAF